VVAQSDRKPSVMRSYQTLLDHGRLGGTGYVSILPVDQGVEHSAGASFAPNPQYFDPENIVKLAIEGGCNAVASTLGVLGSVARKYAHKIPFLVKINHNEMLTYPTLYDQTLFASVRQASEMGAVAVGATVLRFYRVAPADPGNQRSLRTGARTRHDDRALGLPAQSRVQA
jgi:fructose-bisphosphate aldolase, class I